MYVCWIVTRQTEQGLQGLFTKLGARWSIQLAPLEERPEFAALFFEGGGAEIKNPVFQEQVTVALQIALEIGAAGFVNSAVQNNA